MSASAATGATAPQRIAVAIDVPLPRTNRGPLGPSLMKTDGTPDSLPSDGDSGRGSVPRGRPSGVATRNAGAVRPASANATATASATGSTSATRTWAIADPPNPPPTIRPPRAPATIAVSTARSSSGQLTW